MENTHTQYTEFVLAIMVMLVLFVGSVWGILEVGAGILTGSSQYAPRYTLPDQYAGAQPSDEYVLRTNN